MSKYNIGKVIEKIAKSHGITYTSILHKEADVLRLQEIYRQVEEITGDLLELDEKWAHGLLFKVEIPHLETVKHNVIKLAKKIKSEEKC
jgi:hypothetical protein